MKRIIVTATLLAISAMVNAQSIVPGSAAGAQVGQPGAQPPQAGQQGAPVNIYVGGNAPPAGQQQATPAGSGSGIAPLPDLPRSATEAAIQKVLPATPGEIREFREELDKTKRSTNEPLRPTKPSVGELVLSMAPGATPPVVRVTKGFGTMVTFLDETGEPWPIAGADGLAQDVFAVALPSGSDKDASVIQILPKVVYGSGNVAVMLRGQPIPAVFSVEVGYAKSTDYRVDMRVQARGPNARPDPAPVPHAGEIPKYLSDILHEVPPSFAKPLRLTGGEGKAYMVNDKLVIRTAMTILSPVPMQRVPAPGGMTVYEMDFVPVVLATQDGVQRQLSVQE